MKKLTLILLLISSFIYGQIPEDKKLHFVAGSAVSMTTYIAVYTLTEDNKKAFWYSFITPFAVGLVKEIIDEKKYKGFDSKDLLATTLGGATVSLTFNFFDKKHKKKYYSLKTINYGNF